MFKDTKILFRKLSLHIHYSFWSLFSQFFLSFFSVFSQCFLSVFSVFSQSFLSIFSVLSVFSEFSQCFLSIFSCFSSQYYYFFSYFLLLSFKLISFFSLKCPNLVHFTTFDNEKILQYLSSSWHYLNSGRNIFTQGYVKYQF